MTPREEHALPFHLSVDPDADIVEYRALCVLAVAALILGLASPLAVVDPLLWTVPICGTIVSAAALWRIARNSSLTGRRLALAGLWLSVVFAVAGPVDWRLYRRFCAGKPASSPPSGFTIFSKASRRRRTNWPSPRRSDCRGTKNSGTSTATARKNGGRNWSCT